MNTKFESRFAGPANKGLRARICRIANAAGSAPAAAHAVRELAKQIAFSANGLAILADVALDYDPRGLISDADFRAERGLPGASL